MNVLEHKVYLIGRPIPQEYPVQQTHIERTQQYTRYVNRHRVSIQAYDLYNSAVNTLVS